MTITLYLAFGAEFAVLLGLPALGGAARHALAAEGVALLHLHPVGGQAAGAQPQGLNTLIRNSGSNYPLTSISLQPPHRPHVFSQSLLKESCIKIDCITYIQLTHNSCRGHS